MTELTRREFSLGALALLFNFRVPEAPKAAYISKIPGKHGDLGFKTLSEKLLGCAKFDYEHSLIGFSYEIHALLPIFVEKNDVLSQISEVSARCGCRKRDLEHMRIDLFKLMVLTIGKDLARMVGEHSKGVYEIRDGRLVVEEWEEQ